MQQILAQLRAETAPLAGAGDYELLPLVADLERFARTAETDPAGAAADLHGLLIQSQNFYRIAKTREQLTQLGKITKTLGLLKKQLGTETATLQNAFEPYAIQGRATTAKEQPEQI